MALAVDQVDVKGISIKPRTSSSKMPAASGRRTWNMERLEILISRRPASACRAIRRDDGERLRFDRACLGPRRHTRIEPGMAVRPTISIKSCSSTRAAGDA